MVENRTLDSEAKEELTRSLPEVIFDSNFDANVSKLLRDGAAVESLFLGSNKLRISFEVSSGNSDEDGCHRS